MALADPNEPLRLADGTLIDPTTRRPVKQAPKSELVEVPRASEAQQAVVRMRRKLIDLPETPKTMNVIGVILMYSLLGLDNEEIALATNLTEKQVGMIKMSEAYSIVHGDVVQGITDESADEVRGILQSNAKRAAKRVVDMATQDEFPELALRAATDLLDRAGHTSKTIIEHQHKMSGGLRIEVVQKHDLSRVNIDLEAEDVTPNA